MSHRLVYKLLGYLSIVIGIFAALSIYRMQFVFYGVAIGILGFIVSGLNIFLNIKYYYEEEKYPKGYMGMVLSSVPVLFLLILILAHRH